MTLLTAPAIDLLAWLCWRNPPRGNLCNRPGRNADLIATACLVFPAHRHRMTHPQSRSTPHDALRARRRRWAIAALVVVAMFAVGTGCSHLRLKRNTIGQASTVTDIQYQQVLDNLAMFSCNPDSLAWHVKINGGVVQVADQGSGFLGANLGGPGNFSPNFGLQRNVLNQWNVDPVIEADELELLQLAYRKAIDPLDVDGTIKHEIYQKICEQSSGFQIALERKLAMGMVDSCIAHQGDHHHARLTKLRAELEKLYDQIDELSETAQPYDPQHMYAHGGEVPSKLDFLKEEVIRLTSEVCHGSVEPIRAFRRPGRNVGLVEQAQDKIEALVKLIDVPEDGEVNPFSVPWLCHGNKQQVPPCACLVGHYCGCGCECFVWIDPPHMQQFRDFILIVLSLAPPTSQDMTNSPSGLGAANSPNF